MHKNSYLLSSRTLLLMCISTYNIYVGHRRESEKEKMPLLSFKLMCEQHYRKNIKVYFLITCIKALWQLLRCSSWREKNIECRTKFLKTSVSHVQQRFLKPLFLYEDILTSSFLPFFSADDLQTWILYSNYMLTIFFLNA